MPPIRSPSLPQHSLWLLSALLIAAIAPFARAEDITCHLSYGGERYKVKARPTTSPYAVPANHIGTYFRFRIVFQQEPADLAGIRIYTYAKHDSGPVLIHQSSYAYPAKNALTGGFTGVQTVYEPLRDGELQYWCALTAKQ